MELFAFVILVLKTSNIFLGGKYLLFRSKLNRQIGQVTYHQVISVVEDLVPAPSLAFLQELILHPVLSGVHYYRVDYHHHDQFHLLVLVER